MNARGLHTSSIVRTAGLGLLLSLFSLAPVFAQSDYPEISELQRSDLLFRQLVSDIDLFYLRQRSEGPLPPLTFFSYEVKEKDTLFTIAARFNIPYETIATVNGFSNPDDCTDGTRLIIPNRPGVFVPDTPRSSLEQLLTANTARYDQEQQHVTVRMSENTTRSFSFYPGSRFSGTERSFFLHVFFRLPLPLGKITSGYGSRTSPISKHRHFHHGIDIAAPAGTEVKASRRGTVSSTGFDESLGNHVIIEHEGGFSTTYGHLSKIVVENGDQVHYGTIIGYVGSTGLSTGPHLHFEIRSGSRSKNPLQLLPVHTQ
jgi:murein DD-endopeptidase MepM/ murein hydrolase activator NlpD